jgi:hypothetical protein
MMQVAAPVSGTYAGSETTTMEYRVEGYDWAHLYNRTWTIKFLVRSTKTGVMSFSVRALGVTVAYVVPVSITAANTWIPVSIEIPAAPGGSHNLTNGEGARLNWTLGAGPNFIAASNNTWHSSGAIAVSGQTNFMSTLNDDVRISQVMIFPGTNVPDSFVRRGRSIADELHLCQRYYEKSYELDTLPGTATQTNMWSVTAPASGAVRRVTMFFRVRKRAAPTGTLYSTQNTNVTGVVTKDTVDQGVSFTLSHESVIGYEIVPSGAELRTYCHWTADAEL